jgi:hypothetical protein
VDSWEADDRVFKKLSSTPAIVELVYQPDGLPSAITFGTSWDGCNLVGTTSWSSASARGVGELFTDDCALVGKRRTTKRSSLPVKSKNNVTICVADMKSSGN